MRGRVGFVSTKLGFVSTKRECGVGTADRRLAERAAPGACFGQFVGWVEARAAGEPHRAAGPASPGGAAAPDVACPREGARLRSIRATTAVPAERPPLCTPP